MYDTAKFSAVRSRAHTHMGLVEPDKNELAKYILSKR